MAIGWPAWLTENHVGDAETLDRIGEVLNSIPAEDHDAFPDVNIFEVPGTPEGANVREESIGIMQIRVCSRVLRERTNGDRSAQRGLLAHELAHSLLRHPSRLGEGFDEMAFEYEADDKAREWVGSDIDTFRRVMGPPIAHLGPPLFE